MMRIWTRRRALRGAAALLAGVTGCAGEESASSSYPPETVGNVAYDPESAGLRDPDHGPVVWTGARPTTAADEDEDEDEWRGRPWDRHIFVADADDAAAVSVADVSGADDARTFLAATDYDEATVYVERTAIRACFAQDLCHVRWSETDVHTSYARYYRDADVACETDARDTVVTLIRIPEAFDPSDVNGYGSSRGSGTCERRNERLRRRSDAPGGTGEADG
jgi:hypothetical protein